MSQENVEFVQQDGHGTHVAGIIAATAGNGLGISGVCGGRILALKVLPRDGQEFDAPSYYRALRYVIGKAQVLNLSLGGEKDPAEIDVLHDVIAAGVVVIAAMGNEHDEGNPTEYPAAIPEVCAVGATDELDKRAGFSNTGRHIDLDGARRLDPFDNADVSIRRRRRDGVRLVGRHVDGDAVRRRRGGARAGEVAGPHAGAGHQETDVVRRPRRRREEREHVIRRGPAQLREGAALSGGRMEVEATRRRRILRPM